jgi:hypothetical protein
MNRTLKHAVELVKAYSERGEVDYKHVLEFGVYKGGTLTQLRNDLDDSYELFGFDSFEGLPEDWTGTNCKKGGLSTEGFIPTIQGVKMFPGWFTETIPEYVKEKQTFALLHCDADLYSSTIDILYKLNDCIKPGTIIVFDEWYYNHKDTEANRQHEQKAFYEWVADNNREYEIQPEIEDERRIVIITK